MIERWNPKARIMRLLSTECCSRYTEIIAGEGYRMESIINQTMDKMKRNEKELGIQEGYKTKKFRDLEGVKRRLLEGDPLIVKCRLFVR
jgi:hypothetical protein